jgi:hypothetical protein
VRPITGPSELVADLPPQAGASCPEHLRGGGNRTPPKIRNIAAGILAALAFVLLIGYSASFTVYRIEQALVLRFGQPVRTVTEPGLSFKLPLIDRTLKIDNPVIDT